jgi:hypothetical protein
MGPCGSDLVALEEIVLLAAAAVRALQTADEQHSHTHRDENGEDVSIDSEPVHKAAHKAKVSWRRSQTNNNRNFDKTNLLPLTRLPAYKLIGADFKGLFASRGAKQN